MLFSLFHRQKMEVLGCVGLVTHSKSSAVLLNDCLRRIKMLSPLDDAEAQQNVEELPIKPSGDQLAKALAPGNNILPCVEQQCIYSKEKQIPQKVSFLNDIGLHKQSLNQAQCK